MTLAVIPGDPALEAARRLTERIRRVAANVAEQVEELRALVAEAKESEAHLLLGYDSWTAYLRDLFSDEPLRLAREVRKGLVAELHEQGMSTRAIAPIVGVSREQVRQDVAGDKKLSPQPEQESPASSPPLVVRKPAVTGLDGKSYTAPPPQPSKSMRQQNAEQLAQAFGVGVQTLARVASPEGRGVVLDGWDLGCEACTPVVREYVNPTWFRSIARGLNALANQWERR